jgi:hypothetical protein
MTLDNSVPVSFEWALWGKHTDKPDYLVLSHSDGIVRGPDFFQILGRYSPGTLQRSELPQVTISWFQSNGDQNYVGLAIYSETEPGRVARYYCLPFIELTRLGASYAAMYEKFERISLPMNSNALRLTRLGVPSRAAGMDQQRTRLAQRTAALLLTTEAVCVLGAPHVEVTRRLEFIDTVASFLPFGMRARLSAATWTSSTSRDHKFRLFFAAADRSTGDRVVVWDQADESPVGHALADEYLSRLRDGSLSPSRLIGQTTPLGFKPADVERALQDLRLLPGRSGPTVVGQLPDVPFGVAANAGESVGPFSWPPHREKTLPDAAPAPVDEAALGPSDAEIEKTLAACGRALTRPDAQLLEACTHTLIGWRGISDRTRRLIGNKIADHELLNSGSVISAPRLRPFYAELLRLAFTDGLGGLGYRGFRDALSAAGHPIEQQIPSPLAQAMVEVGLTGSVRMLFLGRLSVEDLEVAARAFNMSPDEVADIVIDESVDPDDQDAIGDAALKYLSRPSMRASAVRVAFFKALVERNLITVLERKYASRPERLFDVLTAMLKYIGRGNLTRNATDRIFERLSEPPSVPLLLAVLCTVEPKDAQAVMPEYLQRSIRSWNMAGSTRDQVVRAIAIASQTPAAMTSAPEIKRRDKPATTTSQSWLGVALLGFTFILGIGVTLLLK